MTVKIFFKDICCTSEVFYLALTCCSLINEEHEEVLCSSTYLIHKAIRAGVVIGKRFVHHQKHYAGQKGQGQYDEDGHLCVEKKTSSLPMPFWLF